MDARRRSMVTADTEADQWDLLATALNLWGVTHIAPLHPRPVGLPPTPRHLFGRLLTSGEPRLEQAAIVLLLTHPMLAEHAQAAIASLDSEDRDKAMRRYLAAAALQRMARTRIAIQLGEQPLIPSAYVDELGVSSLDREFGRETLLAVAEQEHTRCGYDAWGGYLALLDVFLAESRRPHWGKPCDSAPTVSA